MRSEGKRTREGRRGKGGQGGWQKGHGTGQGGKSDKKWDIGDMEERQTGQEETGD